MIECPCCASNNIDEAFCRDCLATFPVRKKVSDLHKKANIGTHVFPKKNSLGDMVKVISKMGRGN